MTGPVLITGASGFLGRALARKLGREGEDVVALLRTKSDDRALTGRGIRIERFETPAEVRAIAERLAPSRTFHLATHYLRGHVAADISPLLAANIEVGTQLLDGLVAVGSPVVVASSFFQFRRGVAAPVSLYSATKQAFSEIAAYYRSEEGLPVREAILYETYGPDDPRDKLVPSLVAAARDGREVALGSPDQLLELVHVDDATSALIVASQGDQDRLAVRSLHPISIRELVAAVDEVAGTKLRVSYRDDAQPNPRVTESGEWPGPTGWLPEVDLVEGLRAMLGGGSVTG